MLLVWIGRILLRMALERRVFGRHLRLIAVFLLQKRIKVVLVVLVRGCEMRVGSVPLVPLCSAQPILLLLLVFESSRVALAHRHAASDVLGLGAFFLLVACEPEATAEALFLGLLGVGSRRLGLVGPPARLVVAWRRLRAALELLERLLVEREVGRVSVARGTLWELLLSISLLGNTRRNLLHRRLLGMRDLIGG